MRKDSDTKKGFTIIEVSLVLAIAGLIFLMVFVALPSLQRMTRDTQRKEDITQLMSAIKKYMGNNRQALPTTTAQKNNFKKVYLGDNFKDPTGKDYNIVWGTGAYTYTYTGNAMDYTMHIQVGAKCDGERAVKTENPRRVAIIYRLEGSGVFCDDM